MNEFLILLTDIELFGSDFFDKKDFFELLVKAVFNFLVIGYIVAICIIRLQKIKITYLLIYLSVLLYFSFVFF